MKLELLNIKHMKSLSQETPAYTASLYMDGRKVADISNAGHGGGDDVWWHAREAEAPIAAHFAAMPKRVTDMLLDGKPFEMQPDLESWCHQQLAEREFIKAMRTSARKKVVGVMPDGRDLTFPKLPVDKLNQFRPHIEAKHPGIRFVQDMTDDDLREVMRQAIATVETEA